MWFLCCALGALAIRLKCQKKTDTQKTDTLSPSADLPHLCLEMLLHQQGQWQSFIKKKHLFTDGLPCVEVPVWVGVAVAVAGRVREEVRVGVGVLDQVRVWEMVVDRRRHPLQQGSYTAVKAIFNLLTKWKEIKIAKIKHFWVCLYFSGKKNRCEARILPRLYPPLSFVTWCECDGNGGEPEKKNIVN